mgnify:CR=1 FL=1
MKLFPITSPWQWGFRDALMDSTVPVRGWPPKSDSLALEYRQGYAAGQHDTEAQGGMPDPGAGWEAQDKAACLLACEALRCAECLLTLTPDERTDFMGRTVCDGCDDYLQREHEACRFEAEREDWLERKHEERTEATK